jgi:hypothetical protein
LWKIENYGYTLHEGEKGDLKPRCQDSTRMVKLEESAATSSQEVQNELLVSFKTEETYFVPKPEMREIIQLSTPNKQDFAIP